MRNVIALGIVIAVSGLLFLGLGWAFVPWLPYRRLPRHRVRHLRLRLWLRLHPGHGHATLPELWLRWGRHAAFRRSGRARASLPFWERALRPASTYSIRLGRAHLRHGLRLPVEEHVLVTSPPRAGKTGWLASVILRYPGPVLSTTTKHDVFELTSGIRSRVGPVHVFNPQGIWLSELWSVLYLGADRNDRILAAQAEWQTRLLPGGAEQMAAEAAGCQHRPRGGARAPDYRPD